LFFTVTIGTKAASLALKDQTKFQSQEDFYVEKRVDLRRANPSGCRFCRLSRGKAGLWWWTQYGRV
jgi:hypothetical protein